MWINVSKLQRFYNTELGGFVKKVISNKILDIWPHVLPNEKVLGVGYTVPYMKLFAKQTKCTIIAMPASQGAMIWPKKGGALTSLVNERGLPFADRSIDKVIVSHTLGCTGNPKAMMREIWRVLVDGGSLIVIVTNRLGMWSHFDSTPFGYGSPYTQAQIFRLLSNGCFVPNKVLKALYFFPINSPMFLKSSDIFEKIGSSVLKSFSGVILVEAIKVVEQAQISSSTAKKIKKGLWIPGT